MLDNYQWLNPVLAAELRSLSPQGPVDPASTVRRQFGQAVLVEPWSSQPLHQLVGTLAEDTVRQRIDERSWILQVESPLRASLYRALCTFLSEGLALNYWSEVLGLSVQDFQGELSVRSVTVLTEMVFEWVALSHAVGPSANEMGIAEPADATDTRHLHPSPAEPAAPSDPSVSSAAAQLLSGLSERQLYILQQRLFIPKPRTLASIAEEFGLTRERVRQLESRGAKKIVSELEQHAYGRVLRDAADQFRQTVGPVFPDSHPVVTALLESFIGNDLDGFVSDLLIWLAGPYKFDGNFRVHAELWRPDELDNELEQALQTGPADYPVIQSVYQEHGIRSEFIDALANANPKLNRVSDTYFWGRPTWANRTAAVLRQAGEPLTLEEIAASLGADSDTRSLRNALAQSDEILKVDTRRFGLPEWGYSEYTGVSDAIAAVLEEHGGLAEFADLIPEVAERTGAREQSIRMYGQAPRFVLAEGQIRFRRESEPFAPSTEKMLTRRTVFRFDTHTSIRFRINDEDFRGSGRALPDDIAFHLGAKLDQRIVYTGRGLELPITRPSTAPENGSLGSLRELAIALGSESGDELRIDFYRSDRRFAAALVNENILGIADPLEKLRLLTGATGPNAAALLDEIDAALDYPLVGIEAALRVRGDDDILDALQECSIDNAAE